MWNKALSSPRNQWQVKVVKQFAESSDWKKMQWIFPVKQHFENWLPLQSPAPRVCFSSVITGDQTYFLLVIPPSAAFPITARSYGPGKGWLNNFLPFHVLCSCRDAVKARAVFLQILSGQNRNYSKALNFFKTLQLTFLNLRGSGVKRNPRGFFGA